MEKLIKRKTKIIIKFPFCIVQESLNPKCQKRFQVPVKIKYNVYRSNTLKYAYHIIIASVQLRLARGAGYISSNIILCKRNPGRYDIIIKLLFLFKYTTSVSLLCLFLIFLRGRRTRQVVQSAEMCRYAL